MLSSFENKCIHRLSILFLPFQEWELREFVESEIRKVSKEFTGSKNVVYPFLVFKTLAMRRAGFFVWNIILIMVRFWRLIHYLVVVSLLMKDILLCLDFVSSTPWVLFQVFSNDLWAVKVSVPTEKIDELYLFFPE